jgi:hypothetical protein
VSIRKANLSERPQIRCELHGGIPVPNGQTHRLGKGSAVMRSEAAQIAETTGGVDSAQWTCLRNRFASLCGMLQFSRAI